VIGKRKRGLAVSISQKVQAPCHKGKKRGRRGGFQIFGGPEEGGGEEKAFPAHRKGVVAGLLGEEGKEP